MNYSLNAINLSCANSIPGSQCEPANEHTVIPVFDEAGTIIS